MDIPFNKNDPIERYEIIEYQEFLDNLIYLDGIVGLLSRSERRYLDYCNTHMAALTKISQDHRRSRYGVIRDLVNKYMSTEDGGPVVRTAYGRLMHRRRFGNYRRSEGGPITLYSPDAQRLSLLPPITAKEFDTALEQAKAKKNKKKRKYLTDNVSYEDFDSVME